MRVLTCGGRDFFDKRFAFNALDLLHSKTPVSVVIEGGAHGADSLGRKWAEAHGIPVLTFPVDWELHGSRAGPIRNHKMLRDGRPDMVVAFPGGRGTAHMVKISQAAGVRVWNLAEKYKEWWSRDPFASPV